MAVALVYDSIFGNTAEITRAIARGIEAGGETVTLLAAGEARDFDASAYRAIVVGSPTRGFSATPSIEEFVAGLPEGIAPAAAFDTRLDPETIHPAPLRWVVNAGGYAADRIAAALTRKGYAVKAPNGDFMVTGTEGPLKAGELERAEAWGKALLD